MRDAIVPRPRASCRLRKTPYRSDQRLGIHCRGIVRARIFRWTKERSAALAFLDTRDHENGSNVVNARGVSSGEREAGWMYGESIDRPRHNSAQRSRTDDQGVVSVDEQGDGLESLGLRPTELKVPPRRPWWLAGPSFRFTVFQLCIWGGLFGLRIFQAFYDRGLDPLGWLLLICYGVGVALCFPSIVHYSRIRASTKRVQPTTEESHQTLG